MAYAPAPSSEPAQMGMVQVDMPEVRQSGAAGGKVRPTAEESPVTQRKKNLTPKAEAPAVRPEVQLPTLGHVARLVAPTLGGTLLGALLVPSAVIGGVLGGIAGLAIAAAREREVDSKGRRVVGASR